MVTCRCTTRITDRHGTSDPRCKKNALIDGFSLSIRNPTHASKTIRLSFLLQSQYWHVSITNVPLPHPLMEKRIERGKRAGSLETQDGRVFFLSMNGFILRWVRQAPHCSPTAAHALTSLTSPSPLALSSATAIPLQHTRAKKVVVQEFSLQ